MKRIKKNRSGMTLVEVVIAMAIFSVSVLGITMAFAAAFKYNARNMRRDYELNLQQTSIEKTNAAGMQVYNSSYKAKTILYVDKTSGSTLKSVPSVTEYNAVKSAQNGSDFNFELKTLSSKALGSSKVTPDPTSNQYKISFENLSVDPADVRIITTSGTIYEGDVSTGYRHSSSLYRRTLSGIGSGDLDVEAEDMSKSSPSGFEIGYENDLTADASVTDAMEIIVYQNGALICDYTLDKAEILADVDGILEFTIPVSGGSVIH